MSITYLEACEYQGARCGHIDGKARVGVYTLGEEYAVDLASQGRGAEAEAAFHRGYCAGYRVGADGEKLPAFIRHAVLPEEVSQ